MTDFQKYIQRYLDLIPSNDWLLELEISGRNVIELYSTFSEEQADFSYADGKWSLKVLLQHLIDAERIFVYRALRFSRNDQTELAGWDEEQYAQNYLLTEKSLEKLLEEFKHLRKSTVLFFTDLDRNLLLEKGIANKNELSVETIGQLIVGHTIHHINIIKERYLAQL